MLLALRLFALCAGALQLAVAVHLVRHRPGPFRIAAALLLVANGLAAARLAIVGGPGMEHLFALADGATGPLLLSCGGLLVRFPRHDVRDRLGWALLAAPLAIVAILAAGLWPPVYDAIVVPAYDLLHTFPALAGLGLAGAACAWALRSSRGDDVRLAGLLALGFLPTMGENVVATYDQVHGAWPAFSGNPGRWLGGALLFAGAALAVAWLAWPSRRSRGWRAALLVAMLGAGLAYMAWWQLPPHASAGRVFAVFLGTTTSFYVLRPLAFGTALARRATMWSLLDVAFLLVAVLLGKLASLAALGTPLESPGLLDAFGASVAVLLFVAAAAGARWAWGGPGRAPDRPTSDAALAAFLTDLARARGPEAWVGKDDITQATGITENNVAAAVRRLERRLDPEASAGRFVEERVTGVRGRKRYRLTAEGRARLDLDT